MNEKLRYEMIYSGPLLFKSKLTNQDVKNILSLCKKDKRKSNNKNLAGLIKDEYLIDEIAFNDILQPYFEAFYIAYSKWWNVNTDRKLKIKEAWVNFMKAGECNPIHRHNMDYSSVFYLQIPEGLSKEVKNFVTSGTKPGEITFTFGGIMTECISGYTYSPEVGDFFIFPSNLQHSVSSFRSKGERISVSANFLFSSN